MLKCYWLVLCSAAVLFAAKHQVIKASIVTDGLETSYRDNANKTRFRDILISKSLRHSNATHFLPGGYFVPRSVYVQSEHTAQQTPNVINHAHVEGDAHRTTRPSHTLPQTFPPTPFVAETERDAVPRAPGVESLPMKRRTADVGPKVMPYRSQLHNAPRVIPLNGELKEAARVILLKSQVESAPPVIPLESELENATQVIPLESELEQKGKVLLLKRQLEIAPQVIPLKSEGDNTPQVIPLKSEEDNVPQIIPLKSEEDNAPQIIPLKSEEDNAPQIIPLKSEEDNAPQIIPLKSGQDNATQVIPLESELENEARVISLVESEKGNVALVSPKQQPRREFANARSNLYVEMKEPLVTPVNYNENPSFLDVNETYWSQNEEDERSTSTKNESPKTPDGESNVREHSKQEAETHSQSKERRTLQRVEHESYDSWVPTEDIEIVFVSNPLSSNAGNIGDPGRYFEYSIGRIFPTRASCMVLFSEKSNDTTETSPVVETDNVTTPVVVDEPESSMTTETTTASRVVETDNVTTPVVVDEPESSMTTETTTASPYNHSDTMTSLDAVRRKANKLLDTMSVYVDGNISSPLETSENRSLSNPSNKTFFNETSVDVARLMELVLHVVKSKSIEQGTATTWKLYACADHRDANVSVPHHTSVVNDTLTHAQSTKIVRKLRGDASLRQDNATVKTIESSLILPQHLLRWNPLALLATLIPNETQAQQWQDAFTNLEEEKTRTKTKFFENLTLGQLNLLNEIIPAEMFLNRIGIDGPVSPRLVSFIRAFSPGHLTLLHKFFPVDFINALAQKSHDVHAPKAEILGKLASSKLQLLGIEGVNSTTGKDFSIPLNYNNVEEIQQTLNVPNDVALEVHQVLSDLFSGKDSVYLTVVKILLNEKLKDTVGAKIAKTRVDMLMDEDAIVRFEMLKLYLREFYSFK